MKVKYNKGHKKIIYDIPKSHVWRDLTAKW